MGESQSRYSIVERLTEKKLSLMKSKSSLLEELKSKEQKVDEIKKDLSNWEKDIEQDIKRERRAKERAIEKAMLDFKNSKDRLSDKKKSYDYQITAIEDALKSIEEISRTSTIVQT